MERGGYDVTICRRGALSPRGGVGGGVGGGRARGGGKGRAKGLVGRV